MELCAREYGGNLLLMGCPGAGKSTVGAIVAEMLGMTLIEFDHVLEKVWGMRVGEKLTQLGSDLFLAAEGDAFLDYSTKNSLISLSGSNPMHEHFKKHSRSLGPVFFLDVRSEDILKYLGKKTVDQTDAIVGKHDGITWSEIIEYRQQFYVKNYDVRIICEKGETPTSIAKKVVERWKALHSDSFYVSTRSTAPSTQDKKSFWDVVIEGLASDGGLYVPKQKIPSFTLGQWERLVELPYQERASRILEAWMHPSDIHPSRLQDMIDKAYKNFEHKEIAPVKKLDDDIYILELFHGPTASFKDLALQLMPQIFDEAVAMVNRDSLRKGVLETKYLVLVATSGDTGSAVLEGFRDCHDVSVMVLFPVKGVSTIQKRQMTSMSGGNVKVIGVPGDFDFCQTTMKSIFNDKEFSDHLWAKYRYKLSAANSINWGRLLPQIVYHASGYLDLVKSGEVAMGDHVDLCVPTGGFGNILAAFYMKEMGLPFHSLICASNTNNVFTDFFTTGTYDLQSRKLISSISPSIDILQPSNLERFLYHLSQDSSLIINFFEQLATHKWFKVPKELHQTITKHIDSGWTSEQECKTSIKTCFDKNNYLLDPHTAVGMHVARQKTPARKVLLTATAHYSKFAKDVLLAVGEKPSSESPHELLKQLENLKAEPKMNCFVINAMKKPEIHKDVCPKDLNAIKQSVEDFVVQLDASARNSK